MRKRKRLLRVAVAAGLLVVAVPSAAAAYNLDGGRQAGARSEKAGCSLDPRILRLEPQLCSNASGNDSVRGRAADTARLQGQADAYETQQANQVTADPGATTFDEAPAPAPAASDRTEIEFGWWMVGIAVAAGGVAGLIVGLRRGRPHALS